MSRNSPMQMSLIKLRASEKFDSTKVIFDGLRGKDKLKSNSQQKTGNDYSSPSRLLFPARKSSLRISKTPVT